MIHKHTGRWMWQGSASVVSWSWEKYSCQSKLVSALLYIWPTPGFKNENLKSSGFSTEIILISASALPHCGEDWFRLRHDLTYFKTKESTDFVRVWPILRQRSLQAFLVRHALTSSPPLHLSFNRGCCWGTTDDFTTSFLHFSLFSTALWDLANSRPVHSLMLSSYLFFFFFFFFFSSSFLSALSSSHLDLF